jgi:PAS domain S-box-containing protein
MTSRQDTSTTPDGVGLPPDEIQTDETTTEDLLEDPAPPAPPMPMADSERLMVEELRESQDRYRAIVEFAHSAICVVDSQARLIWINRQMTEISGYTEAQLLGAQSFATFLAPESVQFVLDNFRLFLSGQPYQHHYEFKFIRADGQKRLLEKHMTHYLDRHGQPNLIISMLDITERRQADLDLRDSKLLVESVLENVPLMIFLKEAKDLSFVMFNRAGEEILGRDRSAFLGRSDLDFFPSEQAAFFISKDRAALASNQVVDIPEEPILTAHRGQRWLHTRKVSLRGADGKPKYLLGISEDITEHKLAQEQRARLEGELQQAMKMEAVGRLAGGVAHDFNNLLTGILGNVSLALLDLKPQDPLVAPLTEVHRAAESAATLVRQLLAFSRKQLIEPKVVNLNDIISTLQKMVARLIGEDVELTVRPGTNLGSVKVDPGQFEQILVNLVVNSRDAMPGGGSLLIETCNVDLDQAFCSLHSHTPAGPYVAVTVQDSGEGMSDEVKSHLFEPFFTTKPKGRGTGLGLATIYGAVKQTGGLILVESAPGKGAAFTIYLPRVATKAGRFVGADATKEIPTGIETVLLVEDEPIVRDLAIRFLKRLGYNVIAAHDGASALVLAEAQTEPIDLLLTDVVMPGMNGRQLAERLAPLHPKMKILFTSGYSSDEIANHGIIDEGLNFLGKPYSLPDLAKKLRSVLDGRRGVTTP